MQTIRTSARTTLALLATLLAVPAIAGDAALLDEARAVASDMPPKLLQVLSDEISKGGPEGAVGVCRDRPPRWRKPPPSAPAGRSAASV